MCFTLACTLRTDVQRREESQVTKGKLCRIMEVHIINKAQVYCVYAAINTHTDIPQ